MKNRRFVSIATAIVFMVIMMSTKPVEEAKVAQLKKDNVSFEFMSCPTCPEVSNFTYQGFGYWTWSVTNPTPNYGVYGWEYTIYGDDYYGNYFEDDGIVFSTGYDVFEELGRIINGEQSCVSFFVRQICKDSSSQPVCYSDDTFDFVCD